MTEFHRPKALTVDRKKGELAVVWMDGHESRFSLRWLRANCPCATCREVRNSAAQRAESLTLSAEPPPSTEVVGAELVGNYAVRLDWGDGHSTGIYAFRNLRTCCPCHQCNPAGAPPLLPE